MSAGPDGLISVLCKIVFSVDAASILCSSSVITGRSLVDIFPLSVETMNENATIARPTCFEHALMRCTQMPGYHDNAANIK